MPLRMAPDLQEGAWSRTHLNKHTSELSGIRRKSSQTDRVLPSSSLARSTPRHALLTMYLSEHLDGNPTDIANKKVRTQSAIVPQTCLPNLNEW